MPDSPNVMFKYLCLSLTAVSYYTFVVCSTEGAERHPVLLTAAHALVFYMLLRGWGMGRSSSPDVAVKGDGNKVYGLEHGLLNIEVPLRSMWMNLGYWRHTDKFPQACEQLLEKVFNIAGIDWNRPVFLLDVGIGCGDQTLHIVNLLQSEYSRYIGITLEERQYLVAVERVKLLGDPDGNDEEPDKKIRLFHADAAKPHTWNADLLEAVDENLPVMMTMTTTNANRKHRHPDMARWVLALDTLYHFQPSREGLFRYASEELHASLMAFDLLLADHISPMDRIKLRVISRLLSANFMTEADYRAQLVKAGFEESKIIMSDITDDVFPGLCAFLEKHEGRLRAIGVTSFTRFRWAGRLFKWLSTGKLLRAYIVVTKR